MCLYIRSYDIDMKNNVIKLGFRVLLVFVFTITIGYLMQLSITSGLVYSVLSSRLEKQPLHSLEAFLFRSRHIKKTDVLIVGDDDFIKDVKNNMPSCTGIVDLNMKNFRMSDLAFALSNTETIQRKITVIQNAPHFWTDSRPMESQQKIKLWELYKRKKQKRKLLEYTKGFFNVVSSVLSQSWKREKLTGRQKYFFNISYQFPGMKNKAAYKKTVSSLRKVKRQSVYWFLDVGEIPKDASKKLRKKLIDMFATDVLHKKLGYFKPRDKLNILSDKGKLKCS